MLAEIILGEKFASNADLDGLCGDLEGGGKIGGWSLETVQGVLDVRVFHLLPSLRNQVGIEGQFINSPRFQLTERNLIGTRTLDLQNLFLSLVHLTGSIVVAIFIAETTRSDFRQEFFGFRNRLGEP